MSLTKEYNELVEDLEKNVFKTNKDTDDEQLNIVGKKYFGKEWGGCFAENIKVNFDGNKKYYIFNTDKANESGTHWISVYVDHAKKTVYVFDTFDRETSKLLPDLYLDIKDNHMRIKKGARHIHQKDCELNCGQRSMAYLLLVKNNGIEKILDSSF